MRASYLAALLLGLLAFCSSAQQAFVLTDGTPMRVRLNRNVSSADAKVGEPVDFDVVEDVMVSGFVIIRRGSRVLATVTEAEPKGHMGKAGKLNLSLDHARSVLGEKIALRAVKESNREGGGDLGSLATSIITAPFMMFVKGKDVTIPKGTEVTAYVHGDVRLDEAKIRASAADAPEAAEPASAAGPPPPAVAGPATGESGASPTPQPAIVSAPGNAPQPAPEKAKRAPSSEPSSGMTNADVLALKSAGFSDDLILAKIKLSKCAFRLETSDLIELKTAGLSDRVISAMLDKAK